EDERENLIVFQRSMKSRDIERSQARLRSASALRCRGDGDVRVANGIEEGWNFVRMLDDIVSAARPPSRQRMERRMFAGDPQLFESEILHDARGGADVAGLARLDEHDANHAFRPCVIPTREEDAEESPRQVCARTRTTGPSSALRAPSPRTRGEGKRCSALAGRREERAGMFLF